jgi:hypothetical protein
MLNCNGKILYVGKASSLKSRVNSYFTGRKGKDSKTKELISQVFDLDVSPLPTPLEAALLENDLIKEHDPPYNRALKKRGRSLVYFSSDFASSAAAADQLHVLGPFPRGSTIEPLILLSQGLQTNSFDPGLFWGLLDQDSAERAVSLFFSEYKSDLDRRNAGPITVRNLLALGLSFYRRHLLDTLAFDAIEGRAALSLTYFLGPQAAEGEETEIDRDSTEEVGEGDLAGAGKDCPDPERAKGADYIEQDAREEMSDEELAQIVKSLITGAARAYALARTLVRLLDATISYEEKNRRRKLVFQAGCLVRSEDLSQPYLAEGNEERLFKPGGRRNVAVPVDLATYDRMRVLLAEIRRLCGRGHWISLTGADLMIS